MVKSLSEKEKAAKWDAQVAKNAILTERYNAKAKILAVKIKKAGIVVTEVEIDAYLAEQKK